MLRLVLIVLVAANLIYFGWSYFTPDDGPVLTAVSTREASSNKKGLPAGPPPCATLGPFHDELMAEQAEKQLTRAGWRMQRRALSEEVNDGWWVYVVNTSTATQLRTVNVIRRSGLRDAFAMPDDPEFRVSVGLFSDEQRAEDRAARVQRLKLDAVVKERRKQQLVIWFDLPGVARETLGDGRLATTGLPLEILRIETCPLPAPAAPAPAAPAPAPDSAPATNKSGDAEAAGATGLAATTSSRETRDARV
jgi:hypothetical protein